MIINMTQTKIESGYERVGFKFKTKIHTLPTNCHNCSANNYVDVSEEETYNWNCWSCGDNVCTVVGERCARQARKRWQEQDLAAGKSDDN